MKVDDATIVVEEAVDTCTTYTMKVFVSYLVDGKEMQSNAISASHKF